VKPIAVVASVYPALQRRYFSPLDRDTA